MWICGVTNYTSHLFGDSRVFNVFIILEILLWELVDLYLSVSTLAEKLWPRGDRSPWSRCETLYGNLLGA